MRDYCPPSLVLRDSLRLDVCCHGLASLDDHSSDQGDFLI